MFEKDVNKVGFLTRLIVAHDSLSVEKTGKLTPLKKGDIFDCYEVVEDDYCGETHFHVVDENRNSFIVTPNQVNILSERFDIENNQKVKELESLSYGMELVVVSNDSRLGVGSIVKILETKKSQLGDFVLVETDYKGFVFEKELWLTVSDLAFMK